MTPIEYNDISYDELYAETKRIINLNERIRKEIKKLSAVSNVNNVITEEDLDNIISEDLDELDQSEENSDDEIDYYLDNYRLLPDDFTRDDLLSILPSPKHERYDEIIKRLHAESLKEQILIRNIIESEDDISKDDLIGFKELSKKEAKKIDILKEAQESKDSNIPLQDINNKIVVYDYIIEEIKGINNEYYPSFRKLIDSIVNGTFKNVRPFRDTNKGFGGVSEVKGHQTRVVFKRLDNHTYALVTCFIKKSDKDKLYTETLKNDILYFKNYLLDDTKRKINDSSYMLKNDAKVKALYQKLDGIEKEEGKGK